MFQLREPYTPHIWIPEKQFRALGFVDSSPRVGGVLVETAGVVEESLLYVGLPAVVAGGAAMLLGASTPVVLVAAVAAGGIGYAVEKMTEKSPVAGTTPPGTTPGTTAPAEGSTSTPGTISRESVKEMTNPSPRAKESYATETADEKRARELAENWGYTHGVYDYCRMTGSPYDADPYVYVSHMGTGGKPLLLPPKLLFSPGGKSANDVFEENSHLRKIYIDNYPDSYDFGWKSAREDSGVCESSWSFFS